MNYLPGHGDVTGRAPSGALLSAPYNAYAPDYQSGRHFGGVNVGFADGLIFP